MAVAFDEYVASPTYGGSLTEMSATRKGKIAWGDIDALFLELFPSAVLGIPKLPALCPGSNVLYAESVNFKPLHDDGDQDYTATPPSYTFAEVEINYRTLSYEQTDPGTDQILTRRFAIGGEFMTMKNRGVRWKGEIQAIKDTEFNAGKIIPMQETVITLHRVTAAYYSSLRTAVNSLIGKVNDTTFEGADSETLLFLGGDFQQTVTSDGTSPWQIELKFQQRLAKSGTQEVGWNYAWDDDTGRWREYESIIGGKIYPTGNFALLY